MKLAQVEITCTESGAGSRVKVDGVNMTATTAIDVRCRPNEYTAVTLAIAAGVFLPEQQAEVVFDLPVLKEEHSRLAEQFRTEPSAQRQMYLSGAYQMLSWVLMPDKHAPPSAMVDFGEVSEAER